MVGILVVSALTKEFGSDNLASVAVGVPEVHLHLNKRSLETLEC